MVDTNKKEEKQEEVRKSLKCELCDSRYVYVRVNKTIVCRRCGHVTKPKEQ